VIATTLRLWVQRHVLWPGRERVSGQPTGRRSFGRTGALVILLAAVAALAALAHRFRVQVRSFSDSGPGAGMYDPLRRVTLTAPTARYLNQLPGFLRAQRPPLLAAVTDHHLGHATLVQIEFTAPSPTGLLDAGAQQ